MELDAFDLVFWPEPARPPPAPPLPPAPISATAAATTTDLPDQHQALSLVWNECVVTAVGDQVHPAGGQGGFCTGLGNKDLLHCVLAVEFRCFCFLLWIFLPPRVRSSRPASTPSKTMVRGGQFEGCICSTYSHCNEAPRKGFWSIHC